MVAATTIPDYFALPENARRLIAVAFLLPGTFCSWMLVGQRLRDLGLSGWLALLAFPMPMLEPMYALIVGTTALVLLATVPGSKGHNRYGADPLIEPANEH